MTARDYADAYRVMLKQGKSPEELNSANHIALERGMITLDLFIAAAKVLAETILNR
jgi:hypothetical protein